MVVDHLITEETSGSERASSGASKGQVQGLLGVVAAVSLAGLRVLI